MRVLSRWIVGYGLLLLACNVMDALGWTRLGLHAQTVIGGWAGACLMISAGLAVRVQRRSLRLTGLYISVFLPLVLGTIYTWMAAELWRVRESNKLSATVLSLLALASVGMIWIIVRLRPREGVATRGYAVAISPARHHSPQAESHPQRRSEAG